MINITVDKKIRNACPNFVGVAVLALFTNSNYSDGLWREINNKTEQCRKLYDVEKIKQMSSIKSTRDVYRQLGKDPSRYRPSGESLLRRVLQGKSLYQINTAVDLINLASMEYGYSIGGFDYAKIQGNNITLGVGIKDELYEGIGRGFLNIENMPVYRDSIGGFGTPTSDNERTKLHCDTNRLLALVNGYDGDKDNAMQCANRICELLKKYASCDNYNISTF